MRLGKVLRAISASACGAAVLIGMTLGGGVDWAISHSVWIRLPQLDYHYSQLHNLQGDRQNQFRVSGGIVLRFPPWLWEKQ